MTDIRIADYNLLMTDKVRRLFLYIYPENPTIVLKMSYNPMRQDHVATKVAYLGEDIVGQANIFLHSALEGNANLGFHVCPQTRRRGIATDLSNEAIRNALVKGIRIFYIRTHEDNIGAIAVARKLGFARDDSRFTDKEIVIFKKEF
jgi:RimJ/RimL family protein N-acetyltransferase